MPRIYSPQTLQADAEVTLDAAAARHVQVLRKQPGDALTLFNGQGGEYEAQVSHMGRGEVRVRVGAHAAVERELPCAVHIAMGVPANERMEWLVEKATELGVASIQPLMVERSVLRLAGERADKKVAHWQAIAAAACEQSGRNRVPTVHAVKNLAQWLALTAVTFSPTAPSPSPSPAPSPPSVSTSKHHYLLSLSPQASTLAKLLGTGPQPPKLHFLSGPEGGLSAAEEQLAVNAGFAALSLGPRVLRAETAPLSVLSCVALWSPI